MSDRPANTPISRPEPLAPGDAWLTTDEAAAEFDLHPETVRKWIREGVVKATRLVGKRRYSLRRSDLQQALRARELAQAAAREQTRTSGFIYDGLAATTPPLSASVTTGDDQAALRRIEIVRRIEVADASWRAALGQSVYAPPDEQFAERLRALAAAAAGEGTALSIAAETPGLGWRPRAPRPNVALSYELRPGGNRPGSPDLWNEFDKRVAAIAEAQGGEKYEPIARAFQALAEILHQLADSVDDERGGVSTDEKKRTAG